MEKLKPSKIFKLKRFLTLPEAAQRLSVGLGEEVKETDILQFALDGHLTLSVNFVNTTYGIQGRHIKNEHNRLQGYLLRSMLSLGMEAAPLPTLSEKESIEAQERLTGW
ncbi:hypothetical protein [Methylomonas sp. DH-1]|uniref:hypothetical protein n=1 Tax=Methylomonas sp. (strain DH-1) TaxID=1727196 RepID=UPI0012F638EE|nr:hypothetical protein [Methylomonas sp. DH-1]